MKKRTSFILILVPLTFLGSFNSQAQIAKGSLLLEGNTGNLSFKNGTSKELTPYSSTMSSASTKVSGLSFDLQPTIGYFFCKNIAGGVALSFQYGNLNYTNLDEHGHKYSESTQINSSLGISPFLRCYLPSENLKIRFYGQAGGGVSVGLKNEGSTKSFNQSNVEIFNSKEKYDYTDWHANIMFGLNYFITPAIALNTAIGYEYVTSRFTSKDVSPGPIYFPQEQISTNMESNIRWNVGLSLFIPHKEKIKPAEK